MQIKKLGKLNLSKSETNKNFLFIITLIALSTRVLVNIEKSKFVYEKKKNFGSFFEGYAFSVVYSTRP